MGTGQEDLKNAARGPEEEQAAPSAPTRRRRFYRALVLLAVALTLLATASCAFLARAGQWLVVEDPLTAADVIFVHGGLYPFRALEAAALYQQGWAPAVWLTRRAPGRREKILNDLGIDHPEEATRNREVLMRLGVPPEAIKILPNNVRNTESELEAVSGEARARGVEHVILVTSKQHTRRARAMWMYVVGGQPRATVRYAREDPFDPDRWWSTTNGALDVLHELFGLLNLWAGLPLKPSES